MTGANKTGWSLIPGPVPNPWSFLTTCGSPYIVSTDPADGAKNVMLNASVTVQFSESMNATAVDVNYTPGVGNVAHIWTNNNKTLIMMYIPFVVCTEYAVNVSGKGVRGMDLIPGPVPNPWTFSTMCLTGHVTSAVVKPTGGELWSGGSSHLVPFKMSNNWTSALSFTVSFAYHYSQGGGAILSQDIDVQADSSYDGQISWKVPSVDATDVIVNLTAVTIFNETFSSESGRFRIDSEPPKLLGSYPGSGTSGFKTTNDVWFMWSERVNRTSFEQAFSMTPDPGGIKFEWSVSNAGGDLLVVTHDRFEPGTDYTVTFGATSKDLSDPGNELGDPIAIAFSTQLPPVAEAIGPEQVKVGTAAMFDGSGSTRNITSYLWQITDSEGDPVATLVGAVVNYTFQTEGRYSVKLVVTDVDGLTGEDTLEVVATAVPSPGQDLSGILLVASALAAISLVAATESGRFFLLRLLIVPLYVRARKNDLLEQEARGMILGYILVHPGETYTDIKRNLQLSGGKVSYHLYILQRDGLVQSRTRGTHKLFFPAKMRVPENGGSLHEVQMRILNATRELPGLVVRDVAAVLGISSQHALYHMRELAAKGLIRLDRRGWRLRCYPAEERPASPPPDATKGND